MRFEKKFFGHKLDPNRNEAALGCRTLMRNGEWMVPESQRPAVSAAPDESDSEMAEKVGTILRDLHSERGNSQFVEYARSRQGVFRYAGNSGGLYIAQERKHGAR